MGRGWSTRDEQSSDTPSNPAHARYNSASAGPDPCSATKAVSFSQQPELVLAAPLDDEEQPARHGSALATDRRRGWNPRWRTWRCSVCLIAKARCASFLRSRAHVVPMHRMQRLRPSGTSAGRPQQARCGPAVGRSPSRRKRAQGAPSPHGFPWMPAGIVPCLWRDCETQREGGADTCVVPASVGRARGWPPFGC